MILANWLRRANEGPHSSTALSPLVEASFLAFDRLDFFRCAELAASWAAVSIAVDFEAHGLEAPLIGTCGRQSLRARRLICAFVSL
jgi:hypothetical protein